ncbi:hypothetical protein EKE94_15175 [Mesobaculum littorinae]|uniref:Uncharacterized protein n=1 Tax=Mesobaculum littorinae TaxID=2486419 RepID=A0A438AEB0_9RHOB|nr:TolB family protein [Mesobaculum littorinae]RVV97007.1 hypothetical protein EKE94_15175 [Mesobaculum littorinae]
MKSDLAIYSLETGQVTSVLQSDRHIEAPNWFPNDRELLVNAEGQLYRVPLEQPELRPVDTGGMARLNNDHGICPGGDRFAFCDKTETEAACIYLAAFEGGTPRRVTGNVPSWFHAFSPDGGRIAYVGARDRQMDIYTISTAGGTELRLTEGFETCDGPDYAPTGAHIWFNGQKDGRMQLWRIPTTGGTPEQMTDDDRVNWFPHPSPDGRHVLYLSYPPGTTGHPGGVEVELRLMPASGGEPETLLHLHGGQGTLNVPCWAPDSRRFAFVRYPRQDGSL